MGVAGRLSLAELERRERAERDAAKARRLRVVILAIKGDTAPAIAMSLGLSRRVCRRWVYRDNELGPEGLEDRRGRTPRPPFPAEQRERVCERIEAGPTADEVCALRGRDLQRILAEEFGPLRSLAGVYRLLHRLGYSCLRPRPRHRKSDPEARAAFLRELPSRLREIAAARPDRRLRVYFEDESRFGRHDDERLGEARLAARRRAADRGRVPPGPGGGLSRDGPRRGAAPSAAEHEGRERLPGTVLPDDPGRRARGALVGRGRLPHRRGAAGAGERHRPAAAALQPRTRPGREPVARPHLWHDLKSRFWSNRAYGDYDALEQAAVDAWAKAVLDTELTKTVCAAPYLERASSK